MSYTEASLIVGGVLDECRDFDTDEEYAMWLARVKTEDFGGEHAEVFEIVHNHDIVLYECLCVQYLNDHKPIWTNGVE